MNFVRTPIHVSTFLSDISLDPNTIISSTGHTSLIDPTQGPVSALHGSPGASFSFPVVGTIRTCLLPGFGSRMGSGSLSGHTPAHTLPAHTSHTRHPLPHRHDLGSHQARIQAGRRALGSHDRTPGHRSMEEEPCWVASGLGRSSSAAALIVFGSLVDAQPTSMASGLSWHCDRRSRRSHRSPGSVPRDFC